MIMNTREQNNDGGRIITLLTIATTQIEYQEQIKLKCMGTKTKYEILHNDNPP